MIQDRPHSIRPGTTTAYQGWAIARQAGLGSSVGKSCSTKRQLKLYLDQGDQVIKPNKSKFGPFRVQLVTKRGKVLCEQQGVHFTLNYLSGEFSNIEPISLSVPEHIGSASVRLLVVGENDTKIAIVPDVNMVPGDTLRVSAPIDGQEL